MRIGALLGVVEEFQIAGRMLRCPRFDGGEILRNATTCFLLLLCSAMAFGQDQPQWKVVASVVLFNQRQALPPTTILTPIGEGIYRLTLYFSGGGAGSGSLTEIIGGFDITGAQIASSIIKLSAYR